MNVKDYLELCATMFESIEFVLYDDIKFDGHFTLLKALDIRAPGDSTILTIRNGDEKDHHKKSKACRKLIQDMEFKLVDVYRRTQYKNSDRPDDWLQRVRLAMNLRDRLAKSQKKFEKLWGKLTEYD